MKARPTQSRGGVKGTVARASRGFDGDNAPTVPRRPVCQTRSQRCRQRSVPAGLFASAQTRPRYLSRQMGRPRSCSFYCKTAFPGNAGISPLGGDKGAMKNRRSRPDGAICPCLASSWQGSHAFAGVNPAIAFVMGQPPTPADAKNHPNSDQRDEKSAQNGHNACAGIFFCDTMLSFYLSKNGKTDGVPAAPRRG